MSTRVMISSFVAAGAVVLIAVSASPGSAETTQHSVATPVESPVPMDTCSYGFYTCPDDSAEFDYASSSGCVETCGAIGTKAQVHTVCENYCSATCVDSAWFTCQ